MKEIIIDERGMLVSFLCGFNYGINEKGLIEMYENGGIDELCKDIENEYVVIGLGKDINYES